MSRIIPNEYMTNKLLSKAGDFNAGKDGEVLYFDKEEDYIRWKTWCIQSISRLMKYSERESELEFNLFDMITGPQHRYLTPKKNGSQLKIDYSESGSKHSGDSKSKQSKKK